MLDFEVHIGLAVDPDAPVVAAIPNAWKREPVLKLLSLEDDREYERHNVEGDLRTLMTRHARTLDEVQELVLEAAGHANSERSSRIEVEQVLVSCGRELAIPESGEFSFNLSPDTFPRLEMIPETPPYEVHYCLAWDRPEDAVTVREVAAICAKSNIGIDEIVHFGDDKITTTKFYETLGAMMEELASDAEIFLAALDASCTNLRFRLIAERIITCGIPL